MFNSLKAKFTFAFGTLIVFLFASLGVFMLNSKSNEISTDIAQNTQSFARLTSGTILDKYEEFLRPGNFIPFSRDLSGILRRNQNISGVSISTYSGELVFDSREESEQRYSGEKRVIEDESYLARIQAYNLSLLLDNGEVLYIKLDENGNVKTVDANENEIEDLSPKDRIVDIIIPLENTYAIVYQVSYATLAQRVAVARMQIGSAALLGLILSLLVSFQLSSSITKPIGALKEGALKIATGDFTQRVAVKGKDELGLLAQTFNRMAEDLQISTKAMLYKERVTKELELAVQIQTNLLPKEKLVLPGLDIAGGLIPATEVGGDAFDYVSVNDKQFLCYLGDVTGHGVAAGIVSSIVNSLVYAFKAQTNLITLIHDINDVIRRKITSKVFFTMALTLWNEDTRTLTYANAGHPPVLYYDSQKKTISDIRLQGMAIGMIENVETLVKTQEIKLNPNDVFVMYSDGIVEANNPNHQQFGLANLKRVVQDAANDLEAAESIKNTILAEVIKFINGSEYLDDMTVVVMKAK